MQPSGRIYGGLSARERRERRRSQLLEAGLDAFAKKGWGATTVLDVCRTAGLSQRYFYEAFASREELFEALLDRVGAEVAELVSEVFAQTGGDPERRVRAVLDAVVAHLLDDPRRARVTLVESFATAAFRDRRRQALVDFARLARLQLERLPGAAGERELALRSAVLTGGMAEILVDAVTGGSMPDRDELVDHLTRMWLG